MVSLLLFASVVSAAHLSGKTGGRVELGAALFFWARLVYAPLYWLGIVYLRTAAWFAASIGIGIVASTLFSEAVGLRDGSALDRNGGGGKAQSAAVFDTRRVNAEAASAPIPVQPGGPGPILQTRGTPFVVAGSLCGPAEPTHFGLADA